MFGHKTPDEPWVIELKRRLIIIKTTTGKSWAERGSAIYELFDWLIENIPFSPDEKAQITPLNADSKPEILTKAEKKGLLKRWLRRKKS